MPHETSWVGNTFGGNGTWVQDFCQRVRVSPDGVMYAAAEWDEGGRCIGIYKGGIVDPILLKEYDGTKKAKAWAWGTASQAIAVNQHYIYIGTSGDELLRFHRDTHKYIDATPDVGLVSMSASDAVLATVDAKGTVTLRNAEDLSVTHQFQVAGALDIALAPDGSVSLMLAKSIVHYSAAGAAGADKIDIAKPASIAFDCHGRLIVCDNTSRQVVLYDVHDRHPKPVQTFGIAGGISAPTPGVTAPDKFLKLAGAGMDQADNLYVAMAGSQCDGTVLRSFAPDKTLRWQLIGRQFLDLAVPDPATDGKDLYSAASHYRMDYDRAAGKQWSLFASTLDPDDATDLRRTVKGLHPLVIRQAPLSKRTLIYMADMYNGPLEIYGFDAHTGEFAQHLAEYQRQIKKSWAIWADEAGGIWEAGGKHIVYTPLIEKPGDSKAPIAFGPSQQFDAPAPFDDIQRIQYDHKTDMLLLTGYTPDAKEDAWGLAGRVMARYDGWSKGNTKPAWVAPMPYVYKGAPSGSIVVKSIQFAGDYIFMVGVGTRAMTWVYSAADGHAVGVLHANAQVGGDSNTGWVDMTYALSALRRADGQYLIFVEDDSRNKTLLYQWRPATD